MLPLYGGCSAAQRWWWNRVRAGASDEWAAGGGGGARVSMKRLGLVVGAAVLLLAPGVAEAAPVAAGCRFQLGFAALHDLIPGIVGECRADETHNPEDGDG